MLSSIADNGLPFGSTFDLVWISGKIRVRLRSSSAYNPMPFSLGADSFERVVMTAVDSSQRICSSANSELSVSTGTRVSVLVSIFPCHCDCAAIGEDDSGEVSV